MTKQLPFLIEIKAYVINYNRAYPPTRRSNPDPLSVVFCEARAQSFEPLLYTFHQGVTPVTEVGKSALITDIFLDEIPMPIYK
jgi:hypothetical protein